MHTYIPGKISDDIQVFVTFHEDSSDLLMYCKEQSCKNFLHQKNFVGPLYNGNTNEQSKVLQRTSFS